MRRYPSVRENVSDGVFIHSSTGERSSWLAISSSTVVAAAIRMLCPTVLRSSSGRFAPKYCAAWMEKPWARPMGMESTAQSSHPDADTAARAVTPRSWPTMSESTRLYNCWIRLPARIGMAKASIRTTGFPVVISLVRDMLAPLGLLDFFPQSRESVQYSATAFRMVSSGTPCSFARAATSSYSGLIRSAPIPCEYFTRTFP